MDLPALRPIDHLIRLPTFDGYGDLGLFLQRFESIASHYGWPPEELLFRMKQQITGDAEYVLGDAIHIGSVRDFVEMLKTRFGSEAHAERYRAELTRLRRGTLSLEQLHLRVHSLVSRAMPGPWSKATEIYARDAFLTALDDDDLRRRIMMACPPPETLAAVFDLAVRVSAIDDSFSSSVRRPETNKSVKFTRVLAGPDHRAKEEIPEVVSRAEFQRLYEDQQKLLSELGACRERLGRTESALAVQPKEVVVGKEDTPKPSEKRQSRSVGFDTCRKCHQRGHWARDCPLVIAARTGNNSANRRGANLLTATSRPRNRVYIQLVYEGQLHHALLDTGCDVSVIGAKTLPGLAYQECPQRLYAANASVVPIAGSTELQYKIGGVEMQYEVLVSEAIDEIIFGADWLSDHRCIWDFDRAQIFLRDGEQPRSVPLLVGSRRPCLRRIIAKETTDIPPRCQVDVPVKSMWTTLPSASVDWLMEPRMYRSGVMLARTLLSSDEQRAYVRVLNYSTTTCTIPEEEVLAAAEAVEKQTSSEQENLMTNVSDCDHIQCLIDSLPSSLGNWRTSESNRSHPTICTHLFQIRHRFGTQ
jgi:predicted aspartyl protease